MNVNAVQKLNAILQLLPQINNIVINSLGQISQLVPGLPALDSAKLEVVKKTLTDTLTIVGDLGVEVEQLVSLGMGFATGVNGLITQFHAQQAGNAATLAAPTA